MEMKPTVHRGSIVVDEIAACVRIVEQRVNICGTEYFTAMCLAWRPAIGLFGNELTETELDSNRFCVPLSVGYSDLFLNRIASGMREFIMD